ncbi:tRNA(adenine34) deaminase [Catalinimonas alkaloidigena]|uniref:nucleoside deaminase n=1 Tax=Catalinimonas alkaloidigena TaxID=1075417 RepID=UPI002406CE6E|nr:nucleoside deaminase [Catalinimonas alkaloidigena]MDF9798543.1 tRNA(adenine34) deaminase [Catalinimonas alkaloidigena]
MQEEDYLQLAIDRAHEGKTPFGAVIVQQNKVLAAVFNTVSQSKAPTAHAEVNAIREASQKIGASKLKDAILYTTCEPCPMCTAAALFAGIAEVVYGASIPLISQYLPQIMLRSSELLSYSEKKMLLRSVENVAPYEKLLQQYA